MLSPPTLIPSVILSLILFLHISSPVFAQPSISELSLTAELVLDGLLSPTSIAFVRNLEAQIFPTIIEDDARYPMLLTPV